MAGLVPGIARPIIRFRETLRHLRACRAKPGDDEGGTLRSDFSVERWRKPQRLAELRDMVRAAFAGLTPPSGVLDETLDHFAARFADGIVIVAQSGDGIIGSLFCAQKDGALYLTRMAVVPHWRRRGVGRALMQAAQGEARGLNLLRLTLRVRKTLPDNRAYFEGFGFIVTGEGQDPGRTPYDTMEWRFRE